MPKNIEDIIVPERRKSIRDIPIPEGRRKTDARPVRRAATAPISDVRRSEPARVRVEVDDTPAPTRTNNDFPRRKRRSRKKTIMAVVGALAILFFAILSLSNGATLSYVPKSTPITFENDTYIAEKSGTSGLFYSVVKLSREKGQTAPAGAEEQVSRKASGKIVIYNDNTESQKLVENTRFESAGGKVYRIQSPVTVPSKRTVNGSSQPGTVEVTVYADAPGADYNGALTDFTLPGLKGTARFSTVYARSKTPMEGGFVGKEKVVSAADLTRTKSELENALKEELFIEAEAEVPDDFILFRTLSTFEFENMPQTSGTDSTITVNQKGHLYGVMFKRSDLAKFLGQQKLGLAVTEPVEISSFENLSVAFATVPPADLLSLNEVSFKISGDGELVWITDEASLRTDLVGRSKKDVPGILNNYPTITSANVTVRPFWKGSLPNEVDKIKVIKSSVE